MNRLSTRMLLSHLLVALTAVAISYLTVRLLAPRLFDSTLQQMGGMGMGRGGALRRQVVTAVNAALLWGALGGALAAALAGALAAYQLLKPLGRVRAAARRIADGHYGETLARPRERELAALADDVNHLAAQLDSTETRRVRLLGEVAHEMRTPLTVMEGYLEGIRDGVFPADEQRISLLRGEVRRLQRLSDDLSSLSRADEGRLEITLAESDLTAIVHEAAERLRPRAESADVRLVVTGDRVDARVDAARIGQVVTNLVTNALRATPAGGEVRFMTAVDGADAVVTVSDSGEGLSPDDLTRVFERFYRVPGRRAADDDSGMGVGLTIARDIVRAHDGTLTGASEGLGHGAAFTIRLPLSAPRRAARGSAGR
ncbi:MAG: ATP-binding protein [Micrococcales bacterium]|nr:ATP-binding protein [Micrococcales bacterium]